METTEYVIRLKDRLTKALRKPIRASSQLDSSMGKLNSKGTKSMGALGGAIGKLAGPLALAAAGMKAIMVAGDSVKVARNFEALRNAIMFASGSLEEGAFNMDFIRQRSELLGTDLLSSAEGFKTLAGAMIGSKLQGQATRDIFDSVQVAASVMGLSAENTKGTLLAFGQIMGKGKVQAEELRGQIGERIPGAFKLAADAMGVTTAELDKMMEQGELMAEDFLPKFADQLKKTFGPGLEKSIKSSMANFNRFNNYILEMKIAFGNSLMPAVNAVMGGISKFFAFLKLNKEVILKAFEPLINHFTELRNMTVDFISELTGGGSLTETLQAAFIGLQNYFELIKPALNATRNLIRTIFEVVLKIVDSFVNLGSRFPIIGKLFMGLASLIRVGSVIIIEFLSKILSGVGDIVAGLVNFDFSQMSQGLSTLFLAIDGKGRGAALGEAFTDGFNAELIKNPLVLDFAGGKKPLTLAGSGVLKQGSTGTEGILGSLGILPKNTPPISPKPKEEGGNKSSTTIDSVKSGRPTNININIGKMIESFNVTATNLDDMNNRAKDLVAQALLSAVNNVNNIAN